MRLVIALLLLVCCGCGAPRDERPTAKPSSETTSTKPDATESANVEASPTSDVELQILDFDGIQQLIASKKGKVVVMDAWSTSCTPCLKEFPNLVKLQERLGDKVACVSLSFDYEGIGKPEAVVPKVLEFLKSQNAKIDNVLSSEESDTLYRKFELSSIPAVFVYGADGKLAKRFDNENAATEADAFTYEHVNKFVDDLLAK